MSSSVTPTIGTSAGTAQFSQAFINALNSEIQKIGDQSTKVVDVRNGFIQLAESGTLNTDESRALALIDISFQKMVQKYSTDVFAFSNLNNSRKLSGPSALGDNNYLNNINTVKLPSWARCALGTFGGAILGGLGGVAAGAQVGAHVGAVIGGIFGVIGGAFSGAASSCFIAPTTLKLITIS